MRRNFDFPPVAELPSPMQQLSCIDISTCDVFEALTMLNHTKAAGCDNMSPKILKLCATSLIDPVYHLFNICLEKASFPMEWKIHKMCPILRKGDQTNPQNYHPISLLCILSKVFETVVYKKVIPFICPQVVRHGRTNRIINRYIGAIT